MDGELDAPLWPKRLYAYPVGKIFNACRAKAGGKFSPWKGERGKRKWKELYLQNPEGKSWKHNQQCLKTHIMHKARTSSSNKRLETHRYAYSRKTKRHWRKKCKMKHIEAMHENWEFCMPAKTTKNLLTLQRIQLKISSSNINKNMLTIFTEREWISADI